NASCRPASTSQRTTATAAIHVTPRPANFGRAQVRSIRPAMRSLSRQSPQVPTTAVHEAHRDRVVAGAAGTAIVPDEAVQHNSECPALCSRISSMLAIRSVREFGCTRLGDPRMETQELHRGRLIDHIQLVVRDLPASQRFYEAIFEVLGIPIGGKG